MLDKDYKTRITLDEVVVDDWVTAEGSEPLFGMLSEDTVENYVYDDVIDLMGLPAVDQYEVISSPGKMASLSKTTPRRLSTPRKPELSVDTNISSPQGIVESKPTFSLPPLASKTKTFALLIIQDEKLRKLAIHQLKASSIQIVSTSDVQLGIKFLHSACDNHTNSIQVYDYVIYEDYDPVFIEQNISVIQSYIERMNRKCSSIVFTNSRNRLRTLKMQYQVNFVLLLPVQSEQFRIIIENSTSALSQANMDDREVLEAITYANISHTSRNSSKALESTALLSPPLRRRSSVDLSGPVIYLYWLYYCCLNMCFRLIPLMNSQFHPSVHLP